MCNKRNLKLNIWFILMLFGCSNADITNLNVENPISYQYSKKKNIIVEKINYILNNNESDIFKIIEGEVLDLSGVSPKQKKTGYYELYIKSHKSKYHKVIGGNTENWDDFGNLSGTFKILIEDVGGSTLVKVCQPDIVIVSGAEKKINSHGILTTRRIWTKVPSSNYYEYLFLKTLGDLLNEENMPSIKD
jgi:hypothetical protein